MKKNIIFAMHDRVYETLINKVEYCATLHSQHYGQKFSRMIGRFSVKQLKFQPAY